jgi:hypothetical protein
MCYLMFMEQIPSREVNIVPSSQEIHGFLWEIVHILRQLSRVHITAPYFFEDHFNIVLQFAPEYSE